MSDFEEIKSALKDKWLDYYEDNQSWILKMNDWSYARPSTALILGVISVLEPKVITYLIPMTEIDAKGNDIIRELGLNFDPETELQKRINETNCEVISNEIVVSEIINIPNKKEESIYEIYNIKNNLKNQWLNYYQKNQYWISRFHCWVKFSDSEDRRPMASLILGAMSVIESRLKDYLIPLYGLNNSGEEIIKVLNLDFRPQTELDKIVEEKRLIQDATLIQDVNIIGLLSEDPEYREAYEGLNQIREQIKQENSS